MEDGKVDSLGAKRHSVSVVSWRRTPRNRHRRPRKRDWKKCAPVVMILAILAIIGTRHSLASATGPGVHASLSQLSGSARFGVTQGDAPASRARSTPRRQQSSGISAITNPASPDSRHMRESTPPPVTSAVTPPVRTSTSATSAVTSPDSPPASVSSPVTSRGRIPVSGLSSAAESAVTRATPAVTPATPAAASSPAAAATAAATGVPVTSGLLGVVGALVGLLGL